MQEKIWGKTLWWLKNFHNACLLFRQLGLILTTDKWKLLPLHCCRIYAMWTKLHSVCDRSLRTHFKPKIFNAISILSVWVPKLLGLVDLSKLKLGSFDAIKKNWKSRKQSLVVSSGEKWILSVVGIFIWFLDLTARK